MKLLDLPDRYEKWAVSVRCDANTVIYMENISVFSKGAIIVYFSPSFLK